MEPKKPKLHANFELLVMGLQPLSPEYLRSRTSQNRRKKKKKYSKGGFRIRRKRPRRMKGSEGSQQITNGERSVATIMTQPKDSELERVDSKVLDLANEQEEEVKKEGELVEEEVKVEETRKKSEDGIDYESLERGGTRWVIPKHWALVVYVKFKCDTLSESQDLFSFDNYESAFNGFHKGYQFRGKKSTIFDVATDVVSIPISNKNIINIDHMV